MSIETRSSSALFKRAEQLKRWEDSETNREPSVPKNKSRRIKFSSGCVFLAACAAGDKEEVLRLIQKGADIDTANVDGLTALHQACIDDNLDMVEFLVENGADVNRGDNEGWTPLHATASCGFQSIAKYLLENGADVAAVNNDGELAIDIAECEPMEDLLQAEINQKGVDCDSARSQEERRMLQDARDWVSGDSEVADTPHPKTGATALHVAAAKGYIEVMTALLQGSRPVDVDRQDADGWTPLHAAAHWGQKEAARILADNLADMDLKNYVGQTPFDVADTDMFRYLEELKKTQSAMNNDLIIKQTKRRSDTKLAQADDTETEKPPKVKKVEVEIEKDNQNEINLADSNVALDMDLSLSSDTESETSSETSESETGSENITDDEKKNRVNAEANRIPTSEHNNIGAVRSQAPAAPPRSISDNAQEDTTLPAWRRPASFRSRLGNDSPTKLSLRIGDKDSKSPTSPPSRNNTDADVLLRRTQSFESDEKFYLRYKELRERIKANSYSTIPASPTSQNKTSLKVDNKHYAFDRLSTLPSNNNNNISRQSNNKLFKTSSAINFPSCTDSCSNKVLTTSALIVNRNPTTLTTTANTTSTSLTGNQKSTSIVNNLTEQRPSVNRSYSLRSDRCWPSPRPSRRTSRESLQDVTATAVTTTVTTPTVTTSTANTSPTKVTTTAGSPTATSPQPTSQVRSVTNKAPATVVTPATPPTPSGQTVPNTPTTPTGGSKLSPGNIFKNFFKSFVPPVRDEESETQRKAHAKRVRETRRSTQGVTLDEIKSAEQLVKRKNQPANSTTTSQSTANNNSEPSNGDQSNGSNSQPSVTATITTGVPTVAAQSDGADDSSNMLQERRPSWRLRVDNGSKFKLEDATATSTAAPTVFVRRGTGSAPPRPASAPVESGSLPSDSNVSVPLRRTSKQLDDKEQDKENDVRNAQATQAVIQRRRRPKRRSTGVVHVDMDEIDPDKQDSSGGGDYDDSSKLNHQDSGSESNRSSRLGSSGDIARTENGEINYKELWEQSQADNERLRVKLRQTDEELRDAKQALERITSATTKNSLSELEKREKRAMERKLSEMEEELKQLEALKSENQRLKDENGALIRVISKLSK